MAGEITGREFICALKKAAAWHTPVECGPDDGLLILSDGIKVSVDSELDDSAGQAWINEADPGMMNVSGNQEAYMRYEGFDTALALIMGIAGVPSQIDTTTAYSNCYKLASKIDTLFATLAMKKLANVIWEFPSVKLHGFKISGETNKPLKISLDIIGDKLDRASATNTATTMATVTMPDKKNRILMNKNSVFRMNDQADIALAAGDQIFPSSFELTFNRPMDAEATGGQDGVDEPADNGFPTATLNLKFPRYNTANNAFFDDWEAYTSKKMDITFTGKEIETGQNYMFRILLSHLKIADPEAAMSGPGKIPFSMQCNILGADVAPAGMTNLVEPMQIDVINTRTTDPLA
ncbi:MAG: hypothetical protein KJ804_09085 [Proteobacteria bacterium]|nr:hypothetical protein [Pseudomonadota bacterium]MBU1058453.1 hypothetical protein [Pseudomonadota bacterium]